MLKLKELELENFMCVEHAKFSFTNDKVILITGPNGSGKSTILESIALCLDETKRGDTYKDYIKKGEEHGSVVLSAEIYGKPILFNITLNVKNPPMDRTVTYDNKTYKNSEVSTLLDSFDIKYFSDIIMSMQGSDDITKLTPTQREAFLQKLLSFDFSKQVESCKEMVDDYKSKIDYNGNLIEFNNKTISERKNEIKEISKLDFTQADVDSLNAEIKDLESESTKINDAILDRNKILESKTTLLTEKSNLETKLSELNSSIQVSMNDSAHNNSTITQYKSDINNYSDSMDRIKELNEFLSKTKSELDSFTANDTTDKTDYATILVKYKNDLVEFNTSKDSLNKEYNDLVKVQAEKSALVNTAKTHLSLIDKGICPECGHTFNSEDSDKYQKSLDSAAKEYDDSKALVDKKLLEIDSVNTNIANTNALIADTDLKKSKSDSAILERANTIASYNNTIDKINSQILGIGNPDDKIKELNQKIDDLTKANDSINKALDKIDLDVNDTKASIAKVVLSISDIDKKAEELNPVCNQYRTVSMNLSTAKDKLAEYNNKAMENSMILKNNETIKSTIAKLESDNETANKALSEYSTKKTNTTDALQIFDKTLPQYLIIKTCLVLQTEMNNFIQTIFPNMEIRLFQNKKGVEFFYTNDRENTIAFTKDNLLSVKMASGFEKALMSIAFKVSLCRAYNLKFAFFDEIDQSSTDENSETLFKTLTTSGLFDQIFIITHKPTVRDAIRGVAPNLKTYYVHGKGQFSLDEDY